MSDLLEDLLEIPKFEKSKSYAEQEWEGMPEFYQEDQSSNYQVIVHFRSVEDRDEFAEIIGQHISPKTKSVWHPILPKKSFKEKRYISDES